MTYQALTDPVLAIVLIGVPWMLGASVVLGMAGMAVTSLVRAGWRLARRSRAGAEPEPAYTAEELLLDACVEGGMPEAQARRLLEEAVDAALAQASLTEVPLEPGDATTVAVAWPEPDQPTLSMQLPEVRRG